MADIPLHPPSVGFRPEAGHSKIDAIAKQRVKPLPTPPPKEVRSSLQFPTPQNGNFPTITERLPGTFRSFGANPGSSETKGLSKTPNFTGLFAFMRLEATELKVAGWGVRIRTAERPIQLFVILDPRKAPE